MAEEESSEKPHEPSQRKLDEARKKGEAARSTDLGTAAAYGGLLLAGLSAGPDSVDALGASLMLFLAQPDHLAEAVFGGGSAAPLPALLMAQLPVIAPFFLLPALAALLAYIAQRAFLFSPDKLRPKLSRISPIKTAKQKFGRSGLFEFTKSFVKLVTFSLGLGVFLSSRMTEMAGLLRTNPGIAAETLVRLVLDLLFLSLLIAMCIGAVDYLWQRSDFLRRHRMSDREMRDEHKESEGDPHMKQERRQRGRAIAMNQMMAEVPKADVVIVNPTHYAVALKWERRRGSAPICVAKGVDAVAARIRAAAMEAGVPIHRDPPTARLLYDLTQIGAEVPPDHYRAVATAIRFADAMRKKAKARGR